MEDSAANILSPTSTPKTAIPGHIARGFIRRALERLEKTTGCQILASFEQEFVYGDPQEPKRAYALTSFREQGNFGARLMAALQISPA